MKHIFLLLISLSFLQASLFDYDNEERHHKEQLIDKYRSISSIGNSISKRGQYEKYSSFKDSLKTLHTDVKKLDLNQNDKSSLQTNLNDYSAIIKALYQNMDTKFPKINQHYQSSLDGLVQFNQLVHSTGYKPLLDAWDDLTHTKHRYLKKPSKTLAKKFHLHLQEVKLVLEDLCLDEELEDPMLAYLQVYEQYFDELDSSYKSVKYANIHKLKQLSYEVKSQLTLIIN
ncbi:hypothetical protein [Sulfurimonas sp.]|uniref:hypothetical protein n=1 Tax=Sulfurimonas sp. TaxID=2022749 RepID=UPI003D0F5B56